MFKSTNNLTDVFHVNFNVRNVCGNYPYVSAEVLDKCLFSVLTIPQDIKVNIEATDIRIHFFTNLEQQDLLALDTMSRIFKNISAKVTLVHLPAKRRPFESSNKESLLNVMSFCKKNFPNFEFDTMSINADCAAEQFGCLVKDNPADIIVIPNKRQNAFARFVGKQENVNKMDVTKPVLFISGADDPVGGRKGATAAYNTFKKAGVKDLTLKLYDGLRHEILNEREKGRQDHDWQGNG